MRTRYVLSLTPLILSLVVTAAAQDQIPAEERQALLALYNSTGGANWLKQANWLGPAGTEGAWEGVVVESGHVVSISLPGNGLKGTIPPEIGNLLHLEKLDLTGLIPPNSWGVPHSIKNQISGIPPEVGLLGRLRTLSIGALDLQEVPAEIGNLAALESLSLDENQLKAIPASFGQLTLLKTLRLGNNQLVSLPLEICALANLTGLDVSKNLLTSLPDEIGNLTRLVYLGIYGNKLTKLPPTLGKLIGLTDLNLAGNPLPEIPPELGQLPNLLSVRFGDVGHLPTGIGALQNVQKMEVYGGLRELPVEVGDMLNLRELTIRYSYLKSLPPTLARLVNLEVLDVSHNSLTEIPPVIGQIPSLVTLYLGANPLGGQIPSNLGNLTRLKSLGLVQDSNTASMLSGQLPGELGKMASLEKLVLEGNFTGPIPPEFGNLSNLTVLNLYGQFTTIPPEIGRLQKLLELDICGDHGRIPIREALFTSIPPEIGQMTNLKSLRLVGSPNRIPPEIGNLSGLTTLSLVAEPQTPVPAELGKLKGLLQLELSGGFGGPIPAELAGMTALQVLDLGGNQLTGQIPAWIADLSHLHQLILTHNQLEGPIPPQLGKSKVSHFVLSHNRLSGTIPVELAGLTGFEVDLSHNRLEGNIPYQMVGKHYLFNASSNRLSGILPKELGKVTDTMVRVDWSWNALVPGEASVYHFIGAHHNGEFIGNQSYSPFDLAATATGNSVRLSWSPIPYQSDSGGYQVLYHQREDEPWSVCAMTNSKTASSFTITGLETGRVYYFALRTVTYPHSRNANTVVGEPGNVASAATTASAETWLPLHPEGPAQYTGLAITNIGGSEMHSQVQALSSGGGQADFERNPVALTLVSDSQRAALYWEILGTRSGTGPWSMHLSADRTPVVLCLQGGPRMLDGLVGRAESHKILFFPRVYEGAGALGGQEAQTRVNLLNPGTDPVLVRLKLEGPQIGAALGAVTRTIPPRGLVSETLTELFGLAQVVREAYLKTEVVEGEGIMGVAVVKVGGEKSLFVVPGRPPSGLSQISAAQVASGPGVATSVRLVNTDFVQRNLTLRLHRDEGSPLVVSFPIPPTGLLERDLGQMFQLPTVLTAGSLEVTTDGTGVIGDILVYGSDVSYASAVPLSSRALREGVCGYLANGLGVFTGLAIFNAGDKETEVTVDVLSPEGVSCGKASFKLAAKGRLARQTAELVPSSAGKVGGYVRIKATEPVVVQQMFAADSLDYMATVEPVILK